MGTIEIEINIAQRIDWLSERINLKESDKNYIKFQMKELVIDFAEQIKNQNTPTSKKICKSYDNIDTLHTDAASFLCKPDTDPEDYDIQDYLPVGWDLDIFTKMCYKPYKQRLIIAGLIAAEIDRLQRGA